METRQKKLRKGGRAARLNTSPAPRVLLEKGTQNYTKAPTPDRVCIIACGALVHEILDIIQINDLDHISLTCLPAKLHNTPEAIVPQMEQAISKARQEGFQHIFCGYADCGTGGLLDKLLERENIPRLPGAHCYAFFNGVEDFDRREDDNMRSFFLTDFLARHFYGLTWGPLGLNDNPELLPMYFGNYEKVVFLSQTTDAKLLERAEEIAARLGLKFEHRQTGYGDLRDTLIEI